MGNAFSGHRQIGPRERVGAIDNENEAGDVVISTLSGAHQQIDHQEIQTIGRDVNNYGTINYHSYYNTGTPSLPNSPPSSHSNPSTTPPIRSSESDPWDLSNEIFIVRTSNTL
jgi:hypothetical protein